MKNREQILYIIIGILMGVIVVLGGMFYIYSSRMKEMETQVKTMEKTMESTLVQVKKDKTETSASPEENVDAKYVDVEKEESKKSGKEKKEAEATLPPAEEPEEPDAATEFDDLQPQLENMLQQYQNQVGGDWAVYVEDLDTGGSMSMNDKKMQAASLIKLYIMGAVYERYDEISSGGAVDELLRAMITVSDNDAANELVSLLGAGDSGAGMMAVNAFCTQYGYNQTTMGRLLMQENPSGENYTSVGDCGKFLYHVYNGKFGHSEDMESLLKAQTRRSKIPAGIPEGVEVANKTGELEDVQNDAAIVWGNTPYVVCFMSEGVSGESGPVEAIAQMSGAIYGYINQTQ